MLSYVNIANSGPKHKSASVVPTRKSWILTPSLCLHKLPVQDSAAADAWKL